MCCRFGIKQLMKELQDYPHYWTKIHAPSLSDFPFFQIKKKKTSKYMFMYSVEGNGHF